MNNEFWVDIIGYNGEYKISSLGRIFSVKNNKFLKLQKKKNGYLSIKLLNKGIAQYYSVHRLVAENFLLNVEGKPQVNHKNRIKDDNRLENLEWVSISENTKHFQNEVKIIYNRNRCYTNIDNLDGEIWKKIEGYDKYEVSNYGRIKSFNFTNRVKKPILF